MANECYNRFEVTAPTEQVGALHALLSSAPQHDDADGWLDVLNEALIADAPNGICGDCYYEGLEEDEKLYPFDTVWKLSANADGTSTLVWTCFTKWVGYRNIVCPLVSLLATKYSLIRFEFFESEPADHHGRWVAMTPNAQGGVDEEFSRTATDIIWEDDEPDEVKFLNSTGFDLDGCYPITVWDDGTLSDMTKVLPLTAVID